MELNRRLTCAKCGRHTVLNIQTLLCGDCSRSKKLQGFTTKNLLNEILIRKDKAKEDFIKAIECACDNGLDKQDLVDVINNY